MQYLLKQKSEYYMYEFINFYRVFYFMEVIFTFMICLIGGVALYHGVYFMKNLLEIILYSSMRKHLIFLIILQPLADLAMYHLHFLIYSV